MAVKNLVKTNNPTPQDANTAKISFHQFLRGGRMTKVALWQCLCMFHMELVAQYHNTAFSILMNTEVPEAHSRFSFAVARDIPPFPPTF